MRRIARIPYWFIYRCSQLRVVGFVSLLWLMLVMSPLVRAQPQLHTKTTPTKPAKPDPEETGFGEADLLNGEVGVPLVWPNRAAAAVREREVSPWKLSWVGWDGLGTLEPDTKDQQLLAEMVGCDADKLLYEGKGSVVVRMNQPKWSATAKLAGKPIAAYEYLSASAGADSTYIMQRTWFVLYAPKRAKGTAAEAQAPTKATNAGLVVLLPGMFGTPEPIVDSLVGLFRKHNWFVLRMLTHSSRFTESGMVLLRNDEALEGQARWLAKELGDRAAENAMAVEAVCEYIASTKPNVPINNRTGVGLSGGGMILSTVLARNPDAYHGAIFMGAGCNFVKIGMESNYVDMIDAVRIVPDKSMDAQAMQQLTDTYLAQATFDSYNTATILRDKGLPMLMIEGSKDKAVPTATGDLLWERLGKPERWVGPVGHEALFLAFVPMKSNAMLAWLKTNCTDPLPSGAAHKAPLEHESQR